MNKTNILFQFSFLLRSKWLKYCPICGLSTKIKAFQSSMVGYHKYLPSFSAIHYIEHWIEYYIRHALAGLVLKPLNKVYKRPLIWEWTQFVEYEPLTHTLDK